MTTTGLARPSASTISTNAAQLAMGAIVAYQILLIVLIFLRPDLDPSWHDQRVGYRAKSARRTALDLRSSTSGVSEFCALSGDLSFSHGTGRLRTGREYRLASTLRVSYLHGLGCDLGLASNYVQ